MRKKQSCKIKNRKYRSAGAKRQRLLKASQKPAKYPGDLPYYGNLRVKQSRQRGT